MLCARKISMQNNLVNLWSKRMLCQNFVKVIPHINDDVIIHVTMAKNMF